MSHYSQALFPSLIIQPHSSSTLENWLREFKQFAPDILVVAYYAGKEERPRLRQDLLESQASTSKTGAGWEVLVTTYNLAQGDDRDRKFFRRVEWDVRVANLTLEDYWADTIYFRLVYLTRAMY